MTRRHFVTDRSVPAMAMAFAAASAAALTGAASPSRSLPPPRHLGAVTASTRVGHSVAGRRGPLLFRFVSMPDFINADVGDTRLRAGKGWDPGDPNSINRSWSQSIDTILSAVKAERPAFVLVAGDLVNGHWLADDQNTGIFGPTSTTAQKVRAVSTAGDFYYRAYVRRFDFHDLTVYPAVGDHELGDNPWPARSLKLRAVAAYQRVWENHFTAGRTGGFRFAMHPSGSSARTAYAWRHANTLFVTVDEFATTSRGVRLTVDPDQLSWLARVLGRARRPGSGIQHIVVQGHLPVLGANAPVIPSFHSSRLFLTGRADSAFWRLLHRYHVDVYLAGEMHAYSMRNDGVMQIVHGSLIGRGRMNYLVASVYAHRIDLEIKQFTGATSGTDRLWQMTGTRPFAQLVFSPDPAVVVEWQVP